MENPTFKLEGVIKSNEKTEDFEGPLNLILQLLSKNKIEIKDIKIADILDQYLDYLGRMKSLDLEIASEFITMASHLTYIKARTLLVGQDEEVTELEALINSLEELKRRDSYKQIKEVTGFLAERAEKGLMYFVKLPEALPDGEYRYSHETNELLNALVTMLGREREPDIAAKNITIPARLIYPVGEKTEEIMMTLRDSGKLNVRGIFNKCESKTELVASFMAVLELCKSGSILLEEEDGDYVAIYNGAA